MSDLASQGGHWYAQDGSPVYEVAKAKGDGMRPTTLADARKLNLVPSVTLILRCARAPGLERYWEDQLLDSALTLPVIEGEMADARKERIREDAKEHARMARETGTELHAAIEHFINVTIPPPETELLKWREHLQKLQSVLTQYGIDIFKGKPEHSFASVLGYGGKIDWHNDEVIIDFKTKKDLNAKQLPWPEHCWQLAAYGTGLGQAFPVPRAINVFIGIEDCAVRIHEWPKEDYVRGWDCFHHLLSFWQIKNQFGDKL